MRRPLAQILLLCLFCLVAPVACGGGGESDAQKAADKQRSAAFAPICELTTPVSDTKLPSDFPTLSEITWVKTEKAGPSQIVEGYGDGKLEDLYNELHKQFESSSYKITFDEREDHDAEISFEGGGQSGQVKFADECGQEGRVYVRVTSRPTG
jgi:hypothetical protein